MKLHFYGADRCVTGSCHCLEINGKRILVDCGLQQGRDELDNAMFAFNPGDIDILLVTHAHIDHTGRIPLMVKRGFTGRILTTRVTADLMRIMLLDSAHIQESDAEYRNRKGHIKELTEMSAQEIREIGIRLAFVPEDRLGMGLVSSMGMTDNMMLRSYRHGHGFFSERKQPRELAETIMKELEVVTPSVEWPVGRMSGGNVQKCW